MSDVWDELQDSMRGWGLGQHTDPDREAFSPMMLHTMPLDVSLQDGVHREPIVTVVLQVEGLLVKKEYDRRSGRRHMKRPHMAEFLDTLVKQGNGHVHVWFWSEDSMVVAMGLMDSFLSGGPAGIGLSPATVQNMFPVCLNKEHLFLEGSHLVKRLQPLPRFTPSVVLVDTDPASFRANPNNVILLPPFSEYDDANRDLFVVSDFLRLFRQLHRSKKAKTPQDAIAWLRQRHPEIDSDPARFMARAILEETADARRELELMETESLGATLRRVQSDTVFGKGMAVTPGSTRYQKVHENSLVADRIKKMQDLMRERRAAAAKAQQEGT
jgi:hypothetical protein